MRSLVPHISVFFQPSPPLFPPLLRATLIIPPDRKELLLCRSTCVLHTKSNRRVFEIDATTAPGDFTLLKRSLHLLPSTLAVCIVHGEYFPNVCEVELHLWMDGRPFAHEHYVVYIALPRTGMLATRLCSVPPASPGYLAVLGNLVARRGLGGGGCLRRRRRLPPVGDTWLGGFVDSQLSRSQLGRNRIC